MNKKFLLLALLASTASTQVFGNPPPRGDVTGPIYGALAAAEYGSSMADIGRLGGYGYSPLTAAQRANDWVLGAIREGGAAALALAFGGHADLLKKYSSAIPIVAVGAARLADIVTRVITSSKFNLDSCAVKKYNHNLKNLSDAQRAAFNKQRRLLRLLSSARLLPSALTSVGLFKLCQSGEGFDGCTLNAAGSALGAALSIIYRIKYANLVRNVLKGEEWDVTKKAKAKKSKKAKKADDFDEDEDDDDEDDDDDE